VLAYKKDIYASTGTAVICGLILLLMLWLKLIMPVKAEEHGIEVGYGVDLEGEVGGSHGGSHGNFAGDMDGNIYAKKIEVPSFSEKPATIAKATTQTSNTQTNTTVSDDNFFTQDGESDVAATTGGGKVDKKAAEEARLKAQQEAERQRIAAEKKAKVDEQMRASGLGGSGSSGSTGSDGFGPGTGKGPGSGNGDGTGIGDGKGSGTRGNPLGSGTSNGNNWSLAGRGLSGTIAKPPYNQNVEGKITVDIRVDENGNVTSATIGTPTTIADETLRNTTLQSARKTKFTSGSGTALGKIEYNFKLN